MPPPRPQVRLGDHDVTDERQLLKLAEVLTNVEGLTLDKEETKVDPDANFPWRAVDDDVCALLVRLDSGAGRVIISRDEISAPSYEELTGRGETGYILLVIQKDLRGLLVGGASARCFRRSH